MKKLLLVMTLLLATAGLLFAGGEQEGAEEEIEIQGAIYSYLFESYPLDELAAAYSDKTPNVTVELVPYPEDWEATLKNLQMEAVNRTATFDFITAAAAFLDVATVGRLDLIEPIDQYLTDEVRDDILPSIWEEMQMDGELYAFPMVTDVIGLIYRPSMLEEAGYDRPPETWDEVLEYSEAIDRTFNPDGTSDRNVYPIGFDWYWRPWGGYIPILQSYTDEPFVDGRTDTWSDAARKTLEIMKELHQYMPESAAGNLEASKVFQAGGMAMELYWQPQMLRAIQAGQPEDDINMVQTPEGTRGGTVFWTTGFMLTKYGPHKQEVIDFLSEAFRSREFFESAVDTWKLLPFQSGYDMLGDELPDFFPGLIERIQTGEARAIPNSGYMMGAELDVLREELTKLMNDEQTVQETMDNMTRRIDERIEEMEQE